METIHFKNELTTHLETRREKGEIIGFVPTMGALHEGHLSLITKATKNADLVVVSIFVNPTQFDKPSDLENYPKRIENDLAILRQKFKDLLIFVPQTAEIYGKDLKAEKFDFGELATKMEGRSRTGHFDGVGTILKKLFKIIQPDTAYFGEKDYQQLLIVRKLVTILGLPVKIVGCPIRREENGLAKSSRNKRLSAAQRKEAALLYKSLKNAQNNFNQKPLPIIIEDIKMKFDSNPCFKLDYFEIAEATSLSPITTSATKHKKYRAFIAARIGEVRLIDNMALN